MTRPSPTTASSKSSRRHVVLNSLFVKVGGGVTLSRQLFANLGRLRPDWRVTMVLSRHSQYHLDLADGVWPDNCDIHWANVAPYHLRSRVRFERTTLANWALANRADVMLQLNGMVIPNLGIPTACHFRDVGPYTPDIATSPRDRILAWLRRRAHRASLRRASVVTFNSDYLRSLFAKFHDIDFPPTFVINNGIPDAWADRSQSSLPSWQDRALEIVTIGTVYPYKGHDVVIKALGRLHATTGLEKVRYRVVGFCPPPIEKSLRDLACQCGVSHALSFEGAVSHDLVENHLRSARVHALLSRCESFGMPVIEAMSLGTPVLSSTCGALPEICGGAAALVDPDDLETVVETLRRFLLDRAFSEMHIAKGQAHIKKFSWKKAASRMAECLEQAMAASSSSV